MEESKGKIARIYGKIRCKVKTQSYVLIFQSIYFLINCDTSLTNPHNFCINKADFIEKTEIL